jgi:hypothetical protein
LLSSGPDVVAIQVMAFTKDTDRFSVLGIGRA